MEFSLVQDPSQKKDADLCVIPFWIEDEKVKPCIKNKVFDLIYRFAVESGDFLAKAEETLLIYPSNAKDPRVLLLGLGKRKDASHETLRRAYATVAKMAKKKKWGKICLYFPALSEELIASAFEGFLLANYSFDEYKTEKQVLDSIFYIKHVQLEGITKEAFELCKRKKTLIDSVDLAKNLVNKNANQVTADDLVAQAKKLASAKLKVKILRQKELKQEKAGLILAVNQGALIEPALIIMHYKGDPSSKDLTALIGKGITYDTGGLNLKISGSMETMKCDMAGSAAVIATMHAAQNLKIKKNIIGVVAAAENAIGPASCKPGDVVISHSGKTVEINDTDAEGRLVLADAISYLQKYHKPARMIDLATLTGGIVVALGEEATGLFCNDDQLSSLLAKAGDLTHERLWRMPLFAEYREGLKSTIADIKNSGGRKASSCKGAIFIQQFVKDSTPWAHLDIAGTAFISDPKGYHTSSATGVGVRLLISFLESL